MGRKPNGVKVVVLITPAPLPRGACNSLRGRGAGGEDIGPPYFDTYVGLLCALYFASNQIACPPLGAIEIVISLVESTPCRLIFTFFGDWPDNSSSA
jgi:hypothetical protein